MTLKQLAKLNPEAYESWVAGVDSIKYSFRTTRVYKVTGRLFLIWNNNCYYAAYRWTGSEWTHFKSWPRGKWYQQGCKTIGNLDRPTGFYES